MGPNPICLVSPEEEIETHSRGTGGALVERKPPSASQEERPQEKPTLPTPWFRTSSIQTGDKINFCYFDI